MRFGVAVSKFLFYILIITIIFIFISPVIWMFISSIQPEINVISVPPKISLNDLTFKNYANIIFMETVETSFIMPAMKNSLIVAFTVMVISIVFAIFSSYAFAKLHFLGRKPLFLSVFSLQMLPAVALLIPLFILFRRFGMLDTYPALVLAHSALILPAVVWILKAFFEDFPVELEEAARMDGCGTTQIIFRIILPLSAPALIAAMIFSFIASWNDFIFALILTKTATRTVPLAVAEYMGFYQINYTLACASGIIAVLPTIVLAMFFERYLVTGLFRGAIKG